jgi:DNA-binding transcriptional LysR family regulator
MANGWAQCEIADVGYVCRIGPMLNIHHLELFYYVATHGGISRAVRKIPYGIQQPAVSGQMAQLEENLGTKLFERVPFKLTPAGEKLYGHVASFFSNLGALEKQLREQAVPVMRIGASELLLRHYLPGVVAWLKKKEPRLRLNLRSGYQHELEQAIESGDLDLALVPMDCKPGKRIKTLSLMKIPLVLLVPKNSPIKSAEELWGRDVLDEPLVCLPESESIVKSFRRMLGKKKIHWPASIEASSLDTVTTYVVNGYGIGLSADSQRVAHHPELRMLPLPEVEPIEFVAMWAGQPALLVTELLTQLKIWVDAAWQRSQLASAQAGMPKAKRPKART